MPAASRQNTFHAPQISTASGRPRPGKPVDNAFIESFNGRLRECLNTSWFYGLEQAREVIGAWLEDYNEPHSSLAGLTPVEYERQVRTSRTD